MCQFLWRTVASVLMKREMPRGQIRLFAVIVMVLAPLLLPTPLTVAARGAGKVYRVGHLSTSGKTASKSFIDAFREGMHALGYVEGQNLVLDERYAEGKAENLTSLTQELIRQNPDVLLVSTTPGSLAAKAATSTIPIVMVLVADPVGVGIVQSLARPGGNITGVTNIVAELAGKRLELLKEIVPTASRIAVMVNPDKDALVFILRKETATLAVKYRLPMIYPSREDVEAGGLIAYGASIPEQYRQAATFVHNVLRGAKPADLPVEEPTKFELVINLKTAKQIGLTIPQSVLYRSDKVIR